MRYVFLSLLLGISSTDRFQLTAGCFPSQVLNQFPQRGRLKNSRELRPIISDEADVIDNRIVGLPLHRGLIRFCRSASLSSCAVISFAHSPQNTVVTILGESLPASRVVFISGTVDCRPDRDPGLDPVQREKLPKVRNIGHIVITI